MPATTQIDLGGVWSLVSEGQRSGLTITIPGDVHSALQGQGVIPDPYFGANEAKVQWVAHQDWTIARTFLLEACDLDGSWYLDLDYVDTVATVRVNGEMVLEADNFFRRYRPDVSAYLCEGENTIEVILHSPVRAGKERSMTGSPSRCRGARTARFPMVICCVSRPAISAGTGT